MSIVAEFVDPTTGKPLVKEMDASQLSLRGPPAKFSPEPPLSLGEPLVGAVVGKWVGLSERFVEIEDVGLRVPVSVE